MDTATAEVFTVELTRKGEIAGYRLGARLGYGKSAVVFCAERGGKEYALKVFHPGLIEQYGKTAQLERIEREKKLIGWSHPNVAQVIDGGETPDGAHLFVTMERVPGIPLSAALTHVSRSAIPQLVQQLASAAKALEDYGLVHRDIKPGNIHYIDGPNPSVVLLDLGVLKPIGDSAATNLQTPGVFIGTHQYSPPEMIHGRHEETIDGWRAITFYQLGAVMHDLICQTRIFESSTTRIADLVQAVDNEEVLVRADDVEANLCDLANRCLLKSPADRLRFVEWANFFPSKFEPKSVEERIASFKVRAERTARQGSRNPVLKNEVARTANLHLRQLCTNYRETVDSAIGRLHGVLPPRSTEVTPDVHPKACITCTFVAEPTRGFATPFRTQFSIAEHEGSVAIEVHVRATRGLDETEVGWTYLGGFPKFSGLGEQLAVWLMEIAEEMTGN